MKKFKSFSAQLKMIQSHSNQIENTKNMKKVPKLYSENKLSKQNQEFISSISASGFEQFFLQNVSSNFVIYDKTYLFY